MTFAEEIKDIRSNEIYYVDSISHFPEFMKNQHYSANVYRHLSIILQQA